MTTLSMDDEIVECMSEVEVDSPCIKFWEGKNIPEHFMKMVDAGRFKVCVALIPKSMEIPEWVFSSSFDALGDPKKFINGSGDTIFIGLVNV